MSIEISKKAFIENIKKGGRKVVILRGISGAGKTTMTNTLMAFAPGEFLVVSADSYFMDNNGNYNFNPGKLAEAHAECLRRFNQVMLADPKWNPDAPYSRTDVLVIVDNTNTSIAEIAPYYALATAYGFSCEILTLEVPVEVGVRRNVHGVGSHGVSVQDLQLTLDSKNFPPYWTALRMKEEEEPAVVPTEPSLAG